MRLESVRPRGTAVNLQAGGRRGRRYAVDDPAPPDRAHPQAAHLLYADIARAGHSVRPRGNVQPDPGREICVHSMPMRSGRTASTTHRRVHDGMLDHELKAAGLL